MWGSIIGEGTWCIGMVMIGQGGVGGERGEKWTMDGKKKKKDVKTQYQTSSHVIPHPSLNPSKKKRRAANSGLEPLTYR